MTFSTRVVGPVNAFDCTERCFHFVALSRSFTSQFRFHRIWVLPGGPKGSTMTYYTQMLEKCFRFSLFK